jgi:predicted DNA-binding transcriptional regulator AlpA
MEALLRRKDLLKLFGISNTTLYERITAGVIPKPFYVGGRTPYWRQSEIDQLVADSAARPDLAPAQQV